LLASAYGLPVGAYVKAISPNSPAAHSGLKPQDVITAVGNQAIDDQHDLKSVLDTFHIGDKVKLTVFRSGQTTTLTVTLGKHP